MAYRDNLTAEQVAVLYAPDPQADAWRLRLRQMRIFNPSATMADVISEHVSKRSGKPMRYVNGALVKA